MKFGIEMTLAAIAGAASLAAAQDPAPATWKTSLNLGLSLTEGNSETRVANVALLTEGEEPRLGSVRAGVETHYGEARIGDALKSPLMGCPARAGIGPARRRSAQPLFRLPRASGDRPGTQTPECVVEAVAPRERG